MGNEKAGIRAGWAQADITPDEKVMIAGQFHARVSEGVMDPVTSTALALESVKNGRAQGHTVMVSCDLATISDELRDAVREHVRAGIEGINPDNIFLGATHTHSAPEVRRKEYGTEERDIWPGIELDSMNPSDYLDFAARRIAGAIEEAWERREPSGIGYGLGHAVIGRNRRLTYSDGQSRMYGKAGDPGFSHVEGYEDHSVYAMTTYDAGGKLTGMVVNVPCPSQVSESIYMISADYWHETRRELRRRFGEDIFVLAQCAPSGDQSPHVLIGRGAEERMWRLKGRDTEQNAPREEIAQKIAGAMSDIVPCAGKEIDRAPVFEHRRLILELPRRMLAGSDVERALEDARPFKEKYEKLAAEIERNPAIRKEHRWYTEVTRAFRLMRRGERVRERFELQKSSPNLPVEAHFVRIGDIAFATNPFELYLDYGIRIRELSKAVQTFLIQKAGSSGTYLPSERSIACGGYGSVPASTDIGPEGGGKLVDETVKAINSMFV